MPPGRSAVKICVRAACRPPCRYKPQPKKTPSDDDMWGAGMYVGACVVICVMFGPGYDYW